MPEEQRLERLAERLRAVDPAPPSPGAKIRGWNLVLVAVEQSAAVRPRAHPVRRLVVAAVAIALLLGAGAVAASADSLPDSPLYPLKGVLETGRGALAFSSSDQLAYRLDLARTRLTEAEAMIARHRVDLAGKSLNALDDQLKSAALLVKAVGQADPTAATRLQDELRQAVASDDRQLAGLQDQVQNPAAAAAIMQARQRALDALKVVEQPAASPSASPGSSASSASSASVLPSRSASLVSPTGTP
ncbi:MAG TPA: DUF5667 domain-containing protein [Candidatus Dormibacteraeota bacterium]|nr:DUF5667 domain-containing protein [Candidatus Dormibacteraeota bacterium]